MKLEKCNPRLFTHVTQEEERLKGTEENARQSYGICEIGRQLAAYVENQNSVPKGRAFTHLTDEERNQALEELRREINKECNSGAIEYGTALDRGSVPTELKNPVTFQTMDPSAEMPGIQLRQRVRENFDFESAEFIYTETALVAFDKNGNRKKIGNFAIRLEERKTIKDEEVNEANEVVRKKIFLIWKLAIFIGERAFYTEISHDHLFKFSWVHSAAQGQAFFDETRDHTRLLKMYLQKQISAGKYREIAEYSSPGWKILDDGTEVYLTAEGAIGRPDLPVKANKKFRFFRSNTENQMKNFREFLAMRNIISNHLGNAIFLQYYLLMSTMTALFKETGHQIEFCVAAIGKTNTRKTSCAEIFTRVFNRTPAAVPDINFAATAPAVYEIMDKYADQIVLIDDLTPSENDADDREKRRKLEVILRSYGDRVPRKRSVSYAQNSTAKEFIPITGCALLTGETFSGGKSSRSRVIILRFEDGDVNTEILTYSQENLHILPDFVYTFLEYVTENLNRIKETISVVCDEVRRLNSHEIKMPRYVDALGNMYAITTIFHSFILEKELLDKTQADILIAKDREQLTRVIMENDAELSIVSPAVTILEALRHALCAGKILEKRKEEVSEEDVQNYCLSDEVFFYITSERLWECVKAYTDYRRIYFPYKVGREIIEPLKNEGILYIKREGNIARASHKITIAGKVVNKRFLWLKKETVEKIWGKLEEK